MARIYLLSCNLTVDPYPVYPLGMSLVANAAAAAGHHVRLGDIYARDGGLEDILDEIRNYDPAVIGLSLRNVDDVSFPAPAVYAYGYRTVVRAVKGVSSAPVVLGGSAFTIYPEELLRLTGADYGVVGEGEEIFPELVTALENGRDPSGEGGICKDGICRGGGRLVGDESGLFRRDPLLAEYYLNRGGMLSLQTKRGCPHRCAYCSYPHLEGRRYRFRSPASVVDEIEFLMREYSADYLAITDSVFNDGRGVYLEVCEEIVRRGISIPWMCYLRPQDFTDEEVRLLKRAGLSSVEWGTDCSTDETLRGMGKPFRWDQVVDSNRRFVEAGIPGSHFIMFGGPGETMDTVERGLANLNALEGCVVFAGIGIRVFPDTPIYAVMQGERAGGIAEPLGDGPTESVFYLASQIDPKRIDSLIRDAFEGRMDRIYGDDEFTERISAFHALGYRGPIWDFLLRRPESPRRRRRRS